MALLAGTEPNTWSGLAAAGSDAPAAAIAPASGGDAGPVTGGSALGGVCNALPLDLGAAVVTPPALATEALPSAQSVASRLLPPAPRVPPLGGRAGSAKPDLESSIAGPSPLPTPPGGPLSPSLIASLQSFREPALRGSNPNPYSNPGTSGTRNPTTASHAQPPGDARAVVCMAGAAAEPHPRHASLLPAPAGPSGAALYGVTESAAGRPATAGATATGAGRVQHRRQAAAAAQASAMSAVGTAGGDGTPTRFLNQHAVQPSAATAAGVAWRAARRCQRLSPPAAAWRRAP